MGVALIFLNEGLTALPKPLIFIFYVICVATALSINACILNSYLNFVRNISVVISLDGLICLCFTLSKNPENEKYEGMILFSELIKTVEKVKG